MPAGLSSSAHPGVLGESLLDAHVREVMTPGVISIVEDASLRHALRALVCHRVHAVLVVGRTTGRPLGWVSTAGLLGWLGRDVGMATARDAVTEAAVLIEPSATVRDALGQLSQPGVTHLLVTPSPTIQAEGVVSSLDLVAHAAR